jgi:uncharacterized protein YecT (DUF1311 family)
MNTAKRILPAIFLLCLLCAAAEAQTQTRLNERACAGNRRADAEMNRVYRQILSEYQDKGEFVEKLKEAQRTWVAYRDAHMEALYPGEDKRSLYGSAHEMCACPEMEKLARERTALLRRWLTGLPEGDVCGGTIRTRAARASTRSRRDAATPRQ